MVQIFLTGKRVALEISTTSLRRHNSLTLFLNFQNVAGSFNIAFCLRWIKDLSSEVIQAYRLDVTYFFVTGKRDLLHNSVTIETR